MDYWYYITDKKHQVCYLFRREWIELILELLPLVPDDHDYMNPPENNWYSEDYHKVKQGLELLLEKEPSNMIMGVQFTMIDIEDVDYLIYAFLDHIFMYERKSFNKELGERYDLFTASFFDRYHHYDEDVPPFLKLTLTDETLDFGSQIDIPVDEATFHLVLESLNASAKQGNVKKTDQLITGIEKVTENALKYKMLTCSLSFYKTLMEALKQEYTKVPQSKAKSLQSFFELMTGIDELLQFKTLNSL